jgi:hypothetical protein
MEWFLKFRENQYDEQQAAFSGTSSARTTAGPSGRIHWLFPCSTWNTPQSELEFSPPLPDPHALCNLSRFDGHGDPPCSWTSLRLSSPKKQFYPPSHHQVPHPIVLTANFTRDRLHRGTSKDFLRGCSLTALSRDNFTPFLHTTLTAHAPWQNPSKFHR